MSHLLEVNCYHCGVALPKKRAELINITINGENKQLCCHGCQAVVSVFLDKQLAAKKQLETPKKKCFFFLGYAFFIAGIGVWMFV